MATNAEKLGEKKGGILGFLKKFNKISAAVFLSAGVVFESGTMFGLGLIDVGQAWGLSKFEKWRQNRRARRVGGFAATHA